MSITPTKRQDRVPFAPLRTCVGIVERLHPKVGGAGKTSETLRGLMGYGPKSGTGKQLIAALKLYGFLDEMRDGANRDHLFRISGASVRLIEQGRREDLLSLARTPPIFAGMHPSAGVLDVSGARRELAKTLDGARVDKAMDILLDDQNFLAGPPGTGRADDGRDPIARRGGRGPAPRQAVDGAASHHDALEMAAGRAELRISGRLADQDYDELCAWLDFQKVLARRLRG